MVDLDRDDIACGGVEQRADVDAVDRLPAGPATPPAARYEYAVDPEL
ncbi:MAG: hypothetical protein R3A10_18165 [Caldilineaceae bacterium]